MPKTQLPPIVNEILKTGFEETAGTMVDPSLGLLTIFAATSAINGTIELGSNLVPMSRRLINGPVPPVGSNHVLLQMVHEARWQAVALVAKGCERDDPSNCAFSENYALREIYEIAVQQAQRDINEAVDPLDTEKSAPAGWVSRFIRRFWGQSPQEETEITDTYSELDTVLVQELKALLARDAENQPDRASARAVFAAVKNRCEPLMLDELFSIPKDFGQSAVPAFVQRFTDEKQGWAALFRHVLKGHLEDPDNGGTAKRILLNFAAESLNYTIRIEGLVEGISHDLNDLKAGLDSLDGKIEAILARLSPPLPLFPAGSVPTGSVPYTKYIYTQKQTDFLGRDELIGTQTERGLLDDFMDDEIGQANGAKRAFVWWQIAGDGGQGKSRLALELVERYALDWHTGFLRAVDLKKQDWHAVTFKKPTLFVIDYVAAPEKANLAAEAARVLHERQGALGAPVRMLIVERAPFSFTGSASLEPAWFSTFKLAHGDLPGLMGSCFYPDDALDLPDLSNKAMLAIAGSWRQSQGKSALTAEQEDRLLAKMTHQNEENRSRHRARRPLFAMLFADLIAADGAGDFKLTDALREALATEEKHWPEDARDPSPAAVNLALLATIVGRLARNETQLTTQADFYRADCDDTFRTAWRVVGEDYDPVPERQRAGDDIQFLQGREPDLLGEFMLSYWLCGGVPASKDPGRAEQLMRDAWQIDPGATYAFLVRVAEDMDDLNLRALQRVLARPTAPKPVIEALSPDNAANAAAYYGMTGVYKVATPQAAHPNDNVMPNGAFPLLYAAQNGHTDIVNALLNAGAIVDRSNQRLLAFLNSLGLKGPMPEAVVKLLPAGTPPRLAAGSAPWIDGPYLPGDWHEVARPDWPALAGKLATAVALEPEIAPTLSREAHIESARRLPLVFYPGIDLLEIQISGISSKTPGHNTSLILSALVSEETALLLDGTFVRIQLINRNFVCLYTDEQRRAYLAFFCQFFRGEAGPFSLVDRLDKILFRAPLPPAEAEHLARQISPLTPIDPPDASPDDAIAAYRATVQYETALFISTFALEANGMVHMLDDDPLAADLALRKPRHEGPFRTGPQ